MRALLTTALALAFLLMAGITYVAVTQDPLAGEPRAAVEVAPPDLATLQTKGVPAPLAAPVAAAPAPAAGEASAVTSDANAVAQKDTTGAAALLATGGAAKPAADLTRAAENASAPAQPAVAAKPAPAAQPAPVVDDSVEGASVVVPQ